MSAPYDAIVIGAGPAGLAASIALAQRQARVLVLDEQAAPGGQIYRGLEEMARGMPDLFAAMGRDYAHGDELVARFRTCGAEYRPASTVWQVVPGTDGVEVLAGGEGRAFAAAGRTLLLASGAMERPVPVPGWTLPGVMTAGAVQVLLKSAGVVAEEMVIAGAGPLIYLLAAQSLAAGARLMAVLDTTPRGALLAALPRLPGALRGKGPSYLWKGIALKALLRRSGVPIFRHVEGIVLHGTSEVTDIEFSAGGRPMWLSAGIVALHEGVVPAQQIGRSIGCAFAWDEVQRCFRLVVDAWGNTSVPGVLAAGDGAAIGGALAAEHAGRIAAAEILRRCGRIDAGARDALAAGERRALAAHLAIRPFLDRLYAPPAWATAPDDEVMVCRCEEVTAGQIRAAAAAGAQGPNQAKAFLRVGMGPCQGRMCGPLVSELMAAASGRGVAETGYFHVRPPLKPVTLGELAAGGEPVSP
jgi:NADPH-dependent 2,4-dienoyl-CoA reductase/sulfur reductase-like enzyme